MKQRLIGIVDLITIEIIVHSSEKQIKPVRRGSYLRKNGETIGICVTTIGYGPAAWNAVSLSTLARFIEYIVKKSAFSAKMEGGCESRESSFSSYLDMAGYFSYETVYLLRIPLIFFKALAENAEDTIRLLELGDNDFFLA